MMEPKLELIETSDGSHTLYLPDWEEHYHSRHGAKQESNHVFIQMGLEEAYHRFDEIRILEIGMGTGLNVWLTVLNNRNKQYRVTYTTLEPFPLNEKWLNELNYSNGKDLHEVELFEKVHKSKWGIATALDRNFSLIKQQEGILKANLEKGYNLIYFDAFGPRVQPEMWTLEVFSRISENMTDGGILVTYCAKGEVRRTLQSVGFEVERLKGPPGKREMIRATLIKER